MTSKTPRKAPKAAEDGWPGGALKWSEEMRSKIPALSPHLPRMLMPLGEMIESYAAESDVARNTRLLDLFEYAKRTFPDDRYMAIQRENLSPENIEYLHEKSVLSPMEKYLDFPYWVRSKFGVGIRLGLERHAGQRILDLGAGPAHLGVVARYFGCLYDGLEAKLYKPPAMSRHLYDSLVEFFGIGRITHTIRARQPLPLDQRYRFVTALMGSFCCHAFPDGKRQAWSWPDWVYLIDNLVTDVMCDEYEMYFQINRPYLSADTRLALAKFAKQFNEENCVFTFDQTLDIEELRLSVPAGP